MTKQARARGFELVSKYESESDNIVVPRRGTKLSACYDLFNNTGEAIVLAPGEISGAITTKFKAYMLDDEVLMAYVRSGHGFKYSVKLANSTGIIDCDYYNNEKNEGEIFIKLHNQGLKELVIPAIEYDVDGNIIKAEAMAQVMFQKYLITDDDSDTVGGIRKGGIGSTTI